MKCIAIIFGILIFSNSAFSQHVIEGTVLDDYDNPLPGVNIVLNKTTLGTVTDFDGHFKLVIENEPTMVLLLIRFIGYSSIDFEINTENGYNYKLKANLENGRNRRIKQNKPIEKIKRD